MWRQKNYIIIWLIFSAGFFQINSGSKITFKLLGNLQKDYKNLVISPFSIESGLTLLLAGASGSTEDQISKLLGISADSGVLNIKETQARLLKDDKVLISNSILYQDGIQLTGEFNKTAVESFRATPIPITINRDSIHDIVARINRNVAVQTNGKILEVVTSDIISEDTRLILINTLYFDGKWSKQFEVSGTAPRKFYLSENQYVWTPTMSQKTHFRYIETDNYESVVLGFRNSDIEMVLYRPKHGIDKFINDQNQMDKLDEDYEAMTSQYIDLRVPKFTVSNKFRLRDVLISLGVTDAFDDRRADFSGMIKPGNGPVKLSDVLHDTFIDVTEKGCKAAAVTTGIIMLGRMAHMDRDTPIQLHFDVPFYYVLRERGSGVILFSGVQRRFPGSVLDETEL